MRKIFLLLAALMLVGCVRTNKDEDNNANDQLALELDRSPLYVDITIPKDLIQVEGVPLEDTLAEASKSEDIEKIIDNNDGTISMSVSKEKHQELMESIQNSIEETSNKLIENKENSIVDIESLDDYKVFNIYVDPEKYGGLEFMNALLFYSKGMLYNYYNGDNNAEIIVKFINNETGQLIEEGSSKDLDKLEDEGDSKEDSPLVTVDQLPYSLEIEEPDSLGYVYGFVTFTNNSAYPITGFELTFHMKNKNEKAYFTTYDTVLPGEISPKFKTFSEENKEDMELIKVFIKARNDDGKDVLIYYDVKLDEYNVSVINF
ncbi:MAG: hypothetical protein Q4E36_05570 [Bacillota bacterium]|nr:hypothetical protein [Bacillota bacterium]